MKYFWVQAESLAAAALLGARKGDNRIGRYTIGSGLMRGSILSITNMERGISGLPKTIDGSTIARTLGTKRITTRWGPATRPST